MEQVEDPISLRARIRSAGMTSWALIGISLLLYGFFRYLIQPIASLFAPIAIAAVIVYLLNPLVSSLERRGLRRGFGVLIVYLGFLLVVGLAAFYVIPLIAHQITSLIDALPDYVRRVADAVNEFSARRGWNFTLTPPADLEQLLQDNRETVFRVLGGVRTVAGQLLHVVVTLTIGFVLAAYVLADIHAIKRGFERLIPQRHHEEVAMVLGRVSTSVGGFFRGQLLVAAFVGIASALALTWPVKLPFAVLIGLAAGLFNLIPLVGPFLAAVPAVLVGVLSDHPIRALWAAIALLVVQQIDNHIVSPNVMGRTVQLHPVTVMLALLAGAGIAGIFGMLIVIPIVAAVKTIVLHLWSRRHDLGVTTEAAT